MSTRSRTSGRRIGGSGSEMSSIAMTTFIPGRSFAWSGSLPERVVERVADGRVDVLQRLERRARVDDARAGGQVDLDQLVAGEDGARARCACRA